MRNDEEYYHLYTIFDEVPVQTFGSFFDFVLLWLSCKITLYILDINI